MANDLNSVHIIGRLGGNPESRATQSGTPVCNFSVAVSKSHTDKQSGEIKKTTNWIPVVAWGRLAEICGQYLRKGSQVYIGGEIQVRKWTDKEGKDRWTTEVVADQMQMLGSKPGGGGEQAPAETAEPAQTADDSSDIPF